MKNTLLLVLLAFQLAACSSNSIKEKINQAGDVAGQTAGEFVEGASKGIEKAFDVQVTAAESLTEKGIQLGKASILNDSAGTDNLVVIYMIFNNDFSGKLTVKAFDGDVEIGRASVTTEAKKDEAKHLEFHFDKHTNIDSKNRVTVE